MNHRRYAVLAVVLTVALALVSAWVVKVLGPRAVDPDYFCNCSVTEGLIVMVALPALTIACVVTGLRLRKTRGATRAAGIVAGLAALLLPLAALIVSMVVPFPTIEELNGWALTIASHSPLL